MRVLVVEDDESISLGLRINLEKEGYRVLVRGDGESGLEAARTRAPGVIHGSTPSAAATGSTYAPSTSDRPTGSGSTLGAGTTT